MVHGGAFGAVIEADASRMAVGITALVVLAAPRALEELLGVLV